MKFEGKINFDKKFRYHIDINRKPYAFDNILKVGDCVRIRGAKLCEV
jgi:hypothetical protein